MADHEIEVLDIDPFLDMEEYMILTQSRRLDHDSVVLIEEYWAKWAKHLRVKGITLEDGAKYLVVWLTRVVEEEVNTLWDTSPSQAFALNSMAQVMLMSVIRRLIPEVGVNSCAPVPKPFPALQEALEEAGLPWDGHGTLSRQFAMLTPYPYQGGCTICWLEDECPRANRAEYNLPGREKPAPAESPSTPAQQPAQKRKRRKG